MKERYRQQREKGVYPTLLLQAAPMLKQIAPPEP